MVKSELLEVKKESALVNLPMSLDEISKDAALGGEIGIRDVAVPYLSVLQALSPQLSEEGPKYVAGAKAGSLFLSGLDKVAEGKEKGLLIVPCHYERLFTEWRDRDKGGGLVGSHLPESELVKNAKQGEKGLVLANGNYLTETGYHYCLAQLPDTGVWVQCIFPMKSTALKVSRKMNSALSVLKVPGTESKAPRFLYTWQLTTVREQKDQMVWYSPKLEISAMVTADVYKAAKAFSLIASHGLLRRDAVEASMEEEAVIAKEDVKGDVLKGDNLPF